MSDTFGADDETASGGLQSDMPSIGAASSPPRAAPPSPLSGLAQVAQSLFGGRPAPQPAQPGPSPFQVPGRSQIPQGPPGAQPGGPRWSGTTASLALAQGSPQPRANFNPYQRSLPIRPPSQWGQPEQFGQLPRSFELPGLYQGLSQFFGQNGSALAIPLALAMGKNSGAFLQGLMKGQEQRAKMAREELEDNAKRLALQLAEENRAYSDTASEYEARDPTMGTSIKGVDFRDAMYNKAIQFGDEPLSSLIESGATNANILRFLQLRDSNHQDLEKANKKADEQRALDEQWGLKPAEQTPESTSPFDVGAQRAAGGKITQPAPSVAPEGGAPPTASGGTPQPKPSDELPDTPIHQGATEIFKGNEPGSYVPPDVKNAMALQAAEMRRRAGAILRDPNLKPDQVIPEVRRQLGDTVAADLQGYSQYRSGPGQASGGKEQDYWNLLGDLAQKAVPGDPKNGMPGWNKSTYQAVRDFREQAQKANSPIQRIPTSVEAANNVLADLKAIQDRDGSGAPVSPESLSGAAGKDPLYAQLKIDWIRYNEDIDVLTRGTPSVGMAEQAIGTMPQIPYFGSISGYRAAVRRDMDQARSRVLQLHRTWDQYQTGDVMPGFNPQAEADMDGIRKLDFTTGARPGEVIAHPDGTRYRYLGVNPENPGDRSNWEIAQ